MSLKNTTSDGYDDVPTIVLKKATHFITEPLLHLVILKTTIIKSLFKKGGPGNLSNYRPIALYMELALLFYFCLKSVSDQGL